MSITLQIILVNAVHHLETTGRLALYCTPRKACVTVTLSCLEQVASINLQIILVHALHKCLLSFWINWKTGPLLQASYSVHYCDLVLRDAERVNNPADHFDACSTLSLRINWKTGPLLQASYSVRYCDLVLRDAERVNNPADHFGACSTQSFEINWKTGPLLQAS